MRSRLSLAVPIALTLCAACVDDVATDEGTAGWVHRVYADHGARTLGDVLFPGTHDSASYGVAVESGISPHAGELLVSLWDLPGGDVDGGSQGRVVGWAKTQNLTLREQLDAGARYLDIRVTERDGELLTWHSVYSVPLSVVLDDLVAFASAHPLEPIVISFGLDLDATQYGAFADALTKPRADELSVCDLLIDQDAAASKVTLDALWSSGRSLIWGADGDLGKFLRKNTPCPTSKVPVEGHWSLAVTPDVIAKVLQDTVDVHTGDSLLSNDFIFSLEGTSDRMAQFRFVSSYDSLQAAEEALGFLGDLPGRMIETYNTNGNMGVFAGDAIEKTDLIEAAIQANEREVAVR
jgi:hypothetical protein